MMAALPMLAPRLPGYRPKLDEISYSKEHSDSEWEHMRGVIQKLYIGDNRKLNETMAILQSRHGFAATEQMYKKRLKKWNFRKRRYRTSPCSSNASTPARPDTTPRMSCSESWDNAETLSSESSSMALIRSPKFGPYADLENVLGSVSTWSQAKLDSHHRDSDPMSRYLAHPNHTLIQDSRTMYRTFELVFDLWCHGQGRLAGMAARKGFNALEFVLMDDHPDLVWHVLDTIYDMVDRGHLQLLRIFLDYTNVLAQRQLPDQHPLLRILQQLRQCDYQTEQGRMHVSRLLRLAWLRNVDLLVEHIGSRTPQKLWLYEQLIWDGRTRLRKGSELFRKQEGMSSALAEIAATREQGRQEDESERLRVEALRLEFTQMDLGDRAKAEQLARSLLERTESSSAPLASARFNAYARKMLARLQEDKQDWSTAEKNYRLAIRKREAAHGTNNNLRVIRDMWVLAAHLQKVGKDEEAKRTTADALMRAHALLTEEST